MKQQFSPEKEDVRKETSVHDAVELASPKSGGHEEAMDYPHVVVKLEDDDYSDSENESDSEWMRPMDPVEDDEDENGTSRTKLSPSTFGKHVSPKHEFLEEMGKEESGTSHSSLKLKVRLKKVPKKQVTRKRKSVRQTRGKRVKKELRKTKSSSQFSEGQVDAEGTGNEHKTLSTVQRRTVKVKVKEPSVSPTRVPRPKRSRRSSLDGFPTEDGHNSRPSERKQAMGVFGAGILAPYSRFKAPDAVSPQLATEPPSFPFTPPPGKAHCCQMLEGALFEVLNLCQFMTRTIQRLEEKIDIFHSESSRMWGSHRNFPFSEEVPWQRMPYRVPPAGSSRFGLSRLSFANGPSLVPQVANETARIPTAPARRGKPRLPRSNYSAPSGPVASAQLKKPASVRSTRGRMRGRGGGRGKGRQPTKAAANRAPAFAAPPSEAADTHVPVTTGPPVELSSTASAEDEKLVLIGSPLRNVRISASEYLKAFKEPDPQGAVRVILRAVFPDAALVHCRVTGNRPAGLLQLYPNKVEAIREWLAEMFPKHDLGDNGADWTACLGVMCRVIEGLISGTGREEA